MLDHADTIGRKIADEVRKLTPEEKNAALQWLMDLSIKKTALDVATIESGAIGQANHEYTLIIRDLKGFVKMENQKEKFLGRINHLNIDDLQLISRVALNMEHSAGFREDYKRRVKEYGGPLPGEKLRAYLCAWETAHNLENAKLEDTYHG